MTIQEYFVLVSLRYINNPPTPSPKSSYLGLNLCEKELFQSEVYGNQINFLKCRIHIQVLGYFFL